MTDLWEQARIEREQQKQHAQSEISALCAELETLLLSPPNGNTDILEKQAATLDSMLRAVMQRNINADRKTDISTIHPRPRAANSKAMHGDPQNPCRD